MNIKCPSCGVRIETDSSLIGKQATCPNCQQPFQVPATTLIAGMVLEPFWIQKRIGSGTWGDVFLAKHLPSDQKVALKVLSPVFSEQKPAAEAFVAEANRTLRLEHPQIAKVHELGILQDSYYISLEYVEGESLEARLGRGALSENEALTLLLTLARALRHAWERHSLLHGDLQPANVMITADGTIKLLNLGLHQVFLAGSAAALEVCDARYLAPERAMAQPSSLASDIYAMGAVLYHMLTGMPPYNGADPDELVARHYHDPVPDPREQHPDLSPGTVKLVQAMLAKAPEARPPDWKEVALAAKRLLKAQHGLSTEILNTQEITRLRVALPPRTAQSPEGTVPPAAALAGLPPIPGRVWWRRPVVLGGLAAGVLLAVGLLWVARRPAPPAVPVNAGQPTSVASEDPALAPLYQALAEVRAYAAANPEDLEGALLRYRGLRTRVFSTPLQEVVTEELRRLTQLREAPPPPPEPPPPPPPEATPPAVVEATPDPAAVAAAEAEKQAKLAAEKQAREALQKQLQERYTELRARVAEALVAQQFAEIPALTEAFFADPAASAYKTRLQAFRTLAEKASKWPEWLAPMWRARIGTEFALTLAAGGPPLKVRLEEITATPELKVTVLTPAPGGPRTLTLAELAPAQLATILDQPKEPVQWLMKALWLEASGELDPAIAAYRQVATDLQSVLEASARARQQVALNAQAPGALNAFLTELGMVPPPTEPAAIIEGLGQLYIPSRGLTVWRERAKAFNTRYGKTELAKTHAEVLKRLNSLAATKPDTPINGLRLWVLTPESSELDRAGRLKVVHELARKTVLEQPAGQRLPAVLARQRGGKSAWQFAGNGDVLTLDGAADALTGLEQFTLSVWLRADPANQERGIVLFSAKNRRQDHLALSYARQGSRGRQVQLIQANLMVAGQEQVLESAGQSQVRGDWVHLALTWSTGGALTLHVNGEAIGESFQSVPVKGKLGPMALGQLGRGPLDGPNSSWRGLIEDLRVYERVLPPAELKKLAAGR